MYSVEAVYEDPSEHMTLGFMASGGEYHKARNNYHWLDQKHPYFTSPTCSDNTNWETETVCTSVDEYAIRKATSWVKAPIECWGYTKSSRYYGERFYTYKNCLNKMDPDVSEFTKQSIQEYTKCNSEMGGNRGSQGIKHARGQNS